MFSPSKQKGFIPLMLVGILMFGAVSAEARDHGRRGDRTAKGAVIGAVAGTLFQIIQGKTEGDQILAGAVVGGTIGAVVGSGSGDRYHHGYRDDYYDDGYYYEDGYYQDEGYWDDEEWDRYQDRDDRWDDYEYRNDGYSYDRYGHRSSHRHNDHCNHH